MIRTDIQQSLRCWRSRTEITGSLGQRKAGLPYQKTPSPNAYMHTYIYSYLEKHFTLAENRNVIFFSKLNSGASISLADSKCQSAFPASRKYHPAEFGKTIVLHHNFYFPAFQLHLRNN